MTNTVPTNASAAMALHNLTRAGDRLSDGPNRASSVSNIQNAKADLAVRVVAQPPRTDVGALGTVRQSLDRATSIADVALSTGKSVSDLLNQLKSKAVTAKDGSLNSQSRILLNADFKALLKAIESRVKDASFDGGNLLDGSSTTGIIVLANADASSSVTLSAKNLSLGAGIIDVETTDQLLTMTDADQALGRLDTSVGKLYAAMNEIGLQAKQIETHKGFVGTLVDTLASGVGNLVAGDLAKDSARLQALQVQQQLGAQSASIANQAPQMLLSLFRGG